MLFARRPTPASFAQLLQTEAHSRNIQGTFKERSRNIQGTCKERARNIQGAISIAQGTFKDILSGMP
eukprot:350188-Pyramimonas_sp.AAC.1